MKKTEKLEDYLFAYSNEDREAIQKAAEWAEDNLRSRQRLSGDSEWEHSLRVAGSLAAMGMDALSVIAGLLHHALNIKPEAELEKIFDNKTLSLLVELQRLSILKTGSRSRQASDRVRKMIFAMADDIRIIIVKLADKLDSMRSLKAFPEDRRVSIASETLDVFAPLADRLGINWLKDELEDLALKEINPDAYAQIKHLVSGKKLEREVWLDRVQEQLSGAIALETGRDGSPQEIDAEITRRAKHFYSIYQKMKKRAKSPDELLDLYGIRILTNTEQNCYALLGLVHSLWKPVSGRFKDYIAMPKPNGYRSLHTTVITEDGKTLEVQIRTREMHTIAEYGVASHWLYKQGRRKQSFAEKNPALTKRFQEWSSLLDSSEDYLKDIRRELLGNSILVFTPRGEAIELPKGSCAIDFAFAIHSDIGLRCLSAKANGSIIPLFAELKNTWVVEIQTGKNARPNLNWLNAVKTAKARSKIRQYLTGREEILAIDKNIIARAKSKEKQKPEQFSPIPAVLDYNAQPVSDGEDSARAGLEIAGAEKLLVRFAGCCKPAPGDAIVGYVSRGRGIIIHRDDCPNLPAISEFKERNVDVSWEKSPGLVRRYLIEADMHGEIFSDIEHAAKKQEGRLLEGRLEQSRGMLVGRIVMSFPDARAARILEKNLRQISSVFRLRRIE